jgi:hypothetical protein
MSSNGFLQILDLKVFRLPRLLRVGQRPHRHVIRVVVHATGSWILFTADGGYHDGRLVGGWVLARGRLLGLRWQTADGRHLVAFTSVRLQAPGVGRRLLARLRWPLPEPAAIA